jgi:hypothetical protein
MTNPPYPPPPPAEGGNPGYPPPQQYPGAAPYPGAAQYPPPGTAPYAPEPRKSRTPLYVAIAVVALVAIGAGVYFGFLRGSGNGYDSPRAAVKALMDAAKAKDIGAVKDALCPTDQALASQIGSSDQGDVQGYTIGATTQRDASHASVHVTVTTSGGKEEDDLPVTKESDGWLVCVSDLLSQLPTSLPTG